VEEAVSSLTPVPTVDEQPVQTEEQAILSSFSQPITAGGEPLVVYGHVLDASGAPLSGYAVEIWQVDANGVYDHPGDANTANRDPGFQSYGTALTDENGLFAFRTVVPARYEPRPRHIHFKVKKDGAEVLTSQFYFTGDVDAAQLGLGGEMLLLDLSDAQDAGGSAVKLAFKDIVINVGTGGNLTPTPSQTEGPYYPVIDVAAFDNDLASVQ
jgi:protocatechuate 3,4-dioxygenase beta subunit